MSLITKAIRGTQDILPSESYKWQHVEHTAMSIARDFGYREIRTPVFEHTELFQRSVGETTDVVQKEMYTFDDKGGRSITLRPEGTAGAARAILEHGLYNEAYPIKVAYITSCYRYEKPQAGRLREFHQFGIECFGSSAPQADAEVISLADTLLKELGVTGVSLHINSIGCPDCRAKYHKKLKSYFESNKDRLCTTCNDRLERNPMRILDCKSPICTEVGNGAPVMMDYLCDECRSHFEGVKSCLESAEIEYKVDTRIVRGLDYYTRTVFEFVSDALGSQAVVCGGGRYDGLTEELGGPSIPALGFGMGLERILMVLEAKGIKYPAPPRCEVYFVSMGDEAVKRCFAIVSRLREGGVQAEFDTVGRGLKAQMKYANKIGARYTVVIGDNELETGRARLKNMETGQEEEILIDDSIYINLYNKSIDRQLADMAELLNKTYEG
jgi:histidyl-tRNA synthetase